MSEARADRQLLGVVWAILLIQGAMTLVLVLEGFLGSLAFGSLSAMGTTVVLTGTGALLALTSARGIRRQRRWARRVALVAEWLVLATGVINLAATAFLAQELLVLVPVLTTIVAPIVVIVLLRRLKPLFSPPVRGPAAVAEMAETMS